MLNADAMPFEPGCPALCVSDYDVQAATHGAESDVDDDPFSSSQSEVTSICLCELTTENGG
jgi:hypothetical protein